MAPPSGIAALLNVYVPAAGRIPARRNGAFGALSGADVRLVSNDWSELEVRARSSSGAWPVALGTAGGARCECLTGAARAWASRRLIAAGELVALG